MTPNEKERCRELRKSGMSLRKIGKEIGVSQNAVWSYLKKHGGGYVTNLRTKMVCDRAVYPAIAQWIVEHEISINKFAAACGVSQEAMRLLLDGTHEPRYGLIVRILDRTGMTFEQAFSRRAAGE